jgi:hypothetical protein
VMGEKGNHLSFPQARMPFVLTQGSPQKDSGINSRVVLQPNLGAPRLLSQKRSQILSPIHESFIPCLYF